MKTLYYNGLIYTMDSKIPLVNAMLVEDNQIKAVGSVEELIRDIGSTVIRHDLNNKAVLPGFNDAHLHLYAFANQSNFINLFQCPSMEEAKKKVADFVRLKKLGVKQLIIGKGWHETSINNGMPLTKKDLDHITNDYPMVWVRVCGHSCVVNTKGLELFSIQESKTDQDGFIDFETGVITEQAMDIIEPFLEKTTMEQVKTTILSGLQIGLQNGITSMQTDDLSSIPHEDYHFMLEAYQTLHQEKKLPIRIYLQARLGLTKLKEFIDEGYYTNWGDDFLKIGPLKIMTDGSLGARTAALCSDYADQLGETGILYYQDQELFQLMDFAHHHRMQIVAHAIGDRAMFQILNQLKQIKKTAKNEMRHGIIHCQITTREIIRKMQEENILAIIQPIFLDDDIAIIKQRLGEDRAKESYAFHSMLEKQIPTALSTDCPVTSLNPFANIQAACLRQTRKGYPENGFYPEERLTVYEAVHAYTNGGAYASFDEHKKGKLIPGFFADFIVINQDIFTIPMEQIERTQVLTTIVDGKVRFESQ